MLAPDVLPHLATHFQRAQVVLFIGAGFSRAAKNINGLPVPLLSEFRILLWNTCFPGDPPDTISTVQDLFLYAHSHKRNELTELLRRSFTVDANSIPAEYSVWFSFPWYRIYTLNIDDLSLAVSRRHTLPRKPHAVSATKRGAPGPLPLNALEVIHLNGALDDIPDNVTFSSTQYAERLARQEPWYSTCATDIISHPVVFVGTRLDEPPLWQHLALRGSRGAKSLQELRPKSYLVIPELERARKELLRQYNVTHLPMNMEQFTEQVLGQLSHAANEGHSTLDALRSSTRAITGPRPIPLVAELAAADNSTTSDYLLGSEPKWSDLNVGRAIRRSVDRDIVELANELRRTSGPKGVILITGTAGSGKSTSLMRLALVLSAAGKTVGWIDRFSDLVQRDIRSGVASLSGPDMLFIDDVDVFGIDAASFVRELALSAREPLIVLATRSTKADRLADPIISSGLQLREVVMPHLTDEDIDDLISVLDRENRLGALTGKSPEQRRAVFCQQCGRQLLVAMIRATSDDRFEERILDEAEGLEAESKTIYLLVAAATALRQYLSRDEILLALGDTSNATLNTLNGLIKRHLIVPVSGDVGFGLRHRVVADVVFDELVQHRTVTTLLAKLAFVQSSKVSSGLARSARSWRFLRTLLNHAFLLRTVGVEDARMIYEDVESLLNWDYHYWLQRGSLEVEQGDIRLAERFLGAAHSMAANDVLVRTEYAYLQIRYGVEFPTSLQAQARVNEGMAILYEIIATRGKTDSYPYHVLCSQGLSWSRRASMAPMDRRILLERLETTLKQGRADHPRSQELKQLHDDIRHDLYMIAVDRSDLAPKPPDAD